MKLISENQAVGDGRGWFVLRDLYDTNGTLGGRVYILKTCSIEETKENCAKTTDQLLAEFPISDYQRRENERKLKH